MPPLKWVYLAVRESILRLLVVIVAHRQFRVRFNVSPRVFGSVGGPDIDVLPSGSPDHEIQHQMFWEDSSEDTGDLDDEALALAIAQVMRGSIQASGSAGHSTAINDVVPSAAMAPFRRAARQGG